MKSYGQGDYEFEGDEARSSLWELRHDFLDTLVRLRYDNLFELFRIYNPALHEYIDSDRITDDQLFYSIFVALFQGNPYKLDLSDPTFDTAYIQFYRLIESEEWPVDLDDLRAMDFDDNDFSFASKLIDWQAVRGVKNSKDFCEKIENWGVENNLSEEWAFDYLVFVFQLLYLKLDKRVKNIERGEVDQRLAGQVRMDFDRRVSGAIREALMFYRLKKVILPVFEIDPGIFPEKKFVFTKGKAKWEGFVWNPLTMKRSSFIEHTIAEFGRWRQNLAMLASHQNINHGAYRKRLKKYCSEIRKSGKIRPHVESFGVHGGEVVLIRATWDPNSRESEERFIETAISTIEKRFFALKHDYEIFQDAKEADLEIALAIYCDGIERHSPSGVVAVPTKYRPDHLVWLVESQVPPVLEYDELVVKYGVTNDAMRKGVGTSAKAIGLSLRNRYKGRPKGSRNSDFGSAGRARK